MSNSIYESIMTGLNEALEDAKNTKPILKRHKVTIEPVKVYEAEEVKKIRNSSHHILRHTASQRIICIESRHDIQHPLLLVEEYGLGYLKFYKSSRNFIFEHDKIIVLQ